MASIAAASTAGCGARWTDGQRAELAARHTTAQASDQGGRATSGPSGAPAGPTGATTPTGASTGTGASIQPGSTPDGGAVASGGSAAGSGGPLPCAAPSDAPGISDSEITVGSISSLSGPVPGLGASAATAARAYVAYRNATGGLCGRQIVLLEADDGTDVSRYRSALTELAPNVLGIAGGIAIGDIGSESIVADLAIPIVNAPTGQTGDLPTVFDINPNFARPDMVIGKYRYLYEQGARTVSMTYIAVDQSRREAEIQRHLMEAAGLQVVHVNELPLATLSYDAPARAAANSGANYLWSTTDTTGQAAFARAVDDTGHDWLFREFSYTTYGNSYLELAGAAAEGTMSWLRSLPVEEASTSAAMSTFVEWMSSTDSSQYQDLFAIDSWAATQAFFESLEALPGPISREALVQQLASVQTFDAGGMFAPITLGQDLSQGCFMGMIVRDGRWQRLAPEGSGYLC